MGNLIEVRGYLGINELELTCGILRAAVMLDIKNKIAVL